MVWVACLVAPWAYREHLNVSIQMFADALPAILRRLTELMITSISDRYLRDIFPAELRILADRAEYQRIVCAREISLLL